MAMITRVNYEDMPGYARDMRTKGQELNFNLTSAYKVAEDMHASWYGKRYNALLLQFNNAIPNLNQMLELVVREFPVALETIANNYSRADRGVDAVAVDQQTAPNKIVDLVILEEVGMKFLTAEVNAAKGSIETYFSNATDKMNEIESVYRNIEWQSEASEAFMTKFTNLKAQILQSFEEVKTQFSTLMQQAQDDMQQAENKNTVQ